MIDTDALNAAALLRAVPLLTTLIPGGRIDGDEYCAGSINGGKGQSFRFNTTSGTWCEFNGGSPSGKGFIDLIKTKDKVTFLEAVQTLQDLIGITPEPLPVRRTKKAGFTPSEPQKKPPAVHPELGKPDHIWDYGDGYVWRWDARPGRDKDFRPLTYGSLEGKSGNWHWRSKPNNRNLLYLDALTSKPKILVTEGELKADAARQLTGMVTTTWRGGSHAVSLTDWSPLYGKEVLLWPDHDPAGQKAMEEVGRILAPHCERILMVVPPESSPKGWDAADALREGLSIQQLRPYIQPFAPAPDEEPEPLVELSIEERAEEARNQELFKTLMPLGYTRGMYYFYSVTCREVIMLDGTNVYNKLKQRELIGIDFLTAYYGQPTPKDPQNHDHMNVGDALIRACQRRFGFNPDNMRGIGIWWDDDAKSIIYNFGNKLWVDGEYKEINDFNNSSRKYLYMQGPSVLPAHSRIASDKATGELLTLLKLFPFSKSNYAYLAAGWIALAPFCGILRWRPHIWITGESYSGKTTLLEEIIMELLKRQSYCIMGQQSTEAGVRQTLMGDALPVIFDELETKGKADNVSSIVELMRIASSETKAKVVKGTTTHKSVDFKVRTMMCAASINTALFSQADRSRFSVLHLEHRRGPDAEKRYTAIMDMIAKMVNDPFADALFNRTLQNISVIRRNIDIFIAATVKALGVPRRVGDQLGTLLAGAYSLITTKEVTLQQAEEFVLSMEWARELEFLESKDQDDLVDILLFTKVDVVTKDNRTVRRTIGHLIAVASEKTYDPDNNLKSHNAASALLDVGIRVQYMDAPRNHVPSRGGPSIRPSQEYVLFCSNHPVLQQSLKDTAWYASYRDSLLRKPEAFITKPIAFGPITRSAVAISLENIMRTDQLQALQPTQELYDPVSNPVAIPKITSPFEEGEIGW